MGMIFEHEGQGDEGIEMGDWQDGHFRVGVVELLRRVCALPPPSREDIGARFILDEEAIALGNCNVVLRLAIIRR
jgi:hypothetical protein